MNNPESPLIADCKFKTDKGIGMGSSMDDLIEAYGQPDSINDKKNLKVVSYKNTLRAGFSLSDDKIIHMHFKK